MASKSSNRTHGAKPLRGLAPTHQSTIAGSAKFGRMFRWLEPAQQGTTAGEILQIEDMMQALAKLMVTEEFQENVKGQTFKKRLAKYGIRSPGNTPDAPIMLREKADENPAIAAGYTYFGQFVDHDLTFDPASFLQQLNDPNALVDFRTPRFDLDCVYGRGPADQPYLYTGPDRVKFALGRDIGVDGTKLGNKSDVPRVRHGKDDHPALIGDKRNDENKIVAQIHSLFLQFHNRIYDEVERKFPELGKAAIFNEAQRIVRWCYQWIVLNDFLEKICDPRVYESIQPESRRIGRKTVIDPDHKGPRLCHYNPHGDAFIPVEFAVAAYRFGHSMVRPSYALNSSAKSTSKFPFHSQTFDYARIPIFVAQPQGPRAALNGFGPPLPPGWGIDWEFFFGKPNTHAEPRPQIPQPSYRIDTKLVDPLGLLPEFFRQIPGDKTDPENKERRIASLAFRNLMRGVSMGLPAGERIARMLGISPLKPNKIWNSKLELGGTGGDFTPWKGGKGFFNKHAKWLEGSTPLWFYILKEAEVQHRGERLGKVGSTIVAEAFYGIMWADHFSYLFQEPNWNPKLEKIEGLDQNLDMLRLTRFVSSARQPGGRRR
jgi:Animal haem peroxidase